MPVNWMDVSSLSFNNLLLLERVQLSWFPGWVPEAEFATALQANPVVEWYVRHKCPEIGPWLDQAMKQLAAEHETSPARVRQAEIAILNAIEDLVVYAVDPEVYDAQPFLKWDSAELTGLVDFTAKTVLDIGAGTGRLSLAVADRAATVYAIEPVTNLRIYLKEKASQLGFANVYPVDGLITAIPFSDRFADVVMAAHVFGDNLDGEYREMARVTRLGGMIILCPGNNDVDNAAHEYLVAQGFQWSRFEEPVDGMKRKYWKTLEE